jgi:glycosyltransferase involved in cell wall biosynthesis
VEKPVMTSAHPRISIVIPAYNAERFIVVSIQTIRRGNRQQMKFAYFVLPHIGGTYTVYKSVRTGLATQGVDVRWLGVGPAHLAAMEDPRWAEELLHGEVAGGDTFDEKQQANALIMHLEDNGYDGIFVNAACNKVHSNVVRYLDTRIRRIMTVHTITMGTYAGARALRDHVHATICVSPRIRDDLVGKNGFSPVDTKVIPNAIDISPFVHQVRQPSTREELRLLSLGRIIDSDKGVFWLPKIMKLLADCPAKLTIAGDGPDLAELKRRCIHLDDKVRFLGRISPGRVPGLLAEHDVFLFPSRFEGLGLSLVEAMGSGCVPVASRIKGVTDFVVRDGEDGFLFEIGDVRAASEYIRTLANERGLLARLADAAQKNVCGRFEINAMAKAYAEVVGQVMKAPRDITRPLPIDEWVYPAGLKPGLRTYLPSGLKKWLRLWRERFA